MLFIIKKFTSFQLILWKDEITTLVYLYVVILKKTFATKYDQEKIC